MRRSRANRPRSPKLTHYAQRVAGMVDVSPMTQANAIAAPSLAMMFSMEESGAPILSISDIKGGNGLSVAGTVTLEEGRVAGRHVRAYAFDDDLDAVIPDPGTNDWLMLAAFESVSAGANAFDNGCGAFYLRNITDAGGALVRLQPYMASFSTVNAAVNAEFKQIATQVNPDLLRRTEGQVYIIGAAKRGNILEHWVDGTRVGTADTNLLLDSVAYFGTGDEADAAQTTYDAWQNPNFSGGKAITLGHSACNVVPRTILTSGVAAIPGGDLGTWNPHLQASAIVAGAYEIPGSWYTYEDYDGSVVNQAQDYLGLWFANFAGGLPADIGAAMVWMRDQADAGNKNWWPGWVTR